MKIKQGIYLLIALLCTINSLAQPANLSDPGFENSLTKKTPKVITGADRMEVYLPMLKGKAVAVLANQTSIEKNTHLVDT